LPKIRVPPDKAVRTKTVSEVSKMINALYQNQKERSRKSDNPVATMQLLPSNFDTDILASNLKRELLGKYSVSHDSREKKQRVKKNEASWSVQEKSTDSNPKATSTTKNKSHSQVNDVVIMQPTPPKLLPRPAIVQVSRPQDQTSNLVEAVKHLLSISSPMMHPLVCFDISDDAAKHKFHLFQQANFNFDRILNIKDSPSITSYGSEFKIVDQLEKLLLNHLRWFTLKRILLTGSDWKLEEIDEEERMEDLLGSLKRGNHKSADFHRKFLSDALRKELAKGWELARKGINMNLITFRCPNKVYINDASEHGLGGFVTHRQAW
jgi:hypothetical protein